MNDHTGGPPVYAVLGATGGIGSALCRLLADQGAVLAVAARDEQRLQALAAEIGADALPVDATDSQEVDRLVQDVVERHGRIDGVANCVGSVFLKPAHLTSDEEWQEVLAVNLTSAFAVVRAAARAMMRTGGSIVLVSSVAARVGLANHEAIAAAKGGIAGLVLAAAASYAARGIRVNAVAPGMVRTPATERLTSNEATLKASMALHPLGRIGKPQEVAAAIAWLLDPRQSWVTGQLLGIDGGLATVRPRVSA